MSAQEKPRLMYIINDLEYFFSHRLALAKAVSGAGFEIHVCGPSGAKRHLLERHGFIFHEIKLSRGKSSLLREFYTLFSIFKHAQRVKPHIIHNITIKPVIFGTLIGRLLFRPVILNSINGLGYVFINNTFNAKLLQFFTLFFYKIFFNSSRVSLIVQNKDDLRFFLKRKLAKLEQMYLVPGSGVNLEVFTYTPWKSVPSHPIVILPARVLWDKGVEEFVDCAEMLKAKHPTLRFVLVGGQDLYNPRRVPAEQINDWEKKGIIEWWGHREDIFEVYKQASIVCLPSYREGLPKAIIEAMAVGRPIITTDVPGCREAVKDGKNGFIVPAQDAKALAGVIEGLIADFGKQVDFGRQSRALAEKCFDECIIIRKFLEIINEKLPFSPEYNQ